MLAKQEESSLRIREEEEKRKEVSTKFQATLNEVSAIMAQNTEKNTKLRDDNIDITNKFKTLCDQFEKREDQMIRMAKQMELEKQLSEAHINKVKYELEAERELWAKERDVAKQSIRSGEEQIESLHTHIAGLETHLRVYTDKYAEFEATISKSNRVFDNYKSEMGKLSKQMNKVDKESQAWKSRWEKNAQAVVELSESNHMQDLVLKRNEKRLEQMQNLCRQLQAERTAYLALLRTNGIEPAVADVAAAAAAATAELCPQVHKTRKEVELELLREEMASLQVKLNEDEMMQMQKLVAAVDHHSGPSSPEPKKKSRKRGKHNNKNANWNDKPERKEFLIHIKTDARETVVAEKKEEVVSVGVGTEDVAPDANAGDTSSIAGDTSSIAGDTSSIAGDTSSMIAATPVEPPATDDH